MKPLVILLLFVCVNSHAQNTVSFPENGSSPKAEISDNEINIYALIEHENGSAEEVKFNYPRYKK